MNAFAHLVGPVSMLGWVALKAGLLFLTAVIAFRIAPRRTIAEMAPFDFVAAVAVGAIVGRVPNASGTTFVEGAVTLITVLILHGFIARLRLKRSLFGLVDHVPRILVENGSKNRDELKRTGLTESDLFALLRERGVTDLSEVQYAIFEHRGSVSVFKTSSTVSDDMLRGVATAH